MARLLPERTVDRDDLSQRGGTTELLERQLERTIDLAGDPQTIAARIDRQRQPAPVIADEERIVRRQQALIEYGERRFELRRPAGKHDQRPFLREGDQLAGAVLEWQGHALLTISDCFEGAVGEDSARAQCGCPPEERAPGLHPSYLTPSFELEVSRRSTHVGQHEPFFRAAIARRSSSVTISREAGRRSAATKAAASCRASAVRRGYARRKRTAASRTGSLDPPHASCWPGVGAARMRGSRLRARSAPSRPSRAIARRTHFAGPRRASTGPPQSAIVTHVVADSAVSRGTIAEASQNLTAVATIIQERP